MDSNKAVTAAAETRDQQREYNAPAIESVMTPEALAREVQYAGNFDNTNPIVVSG